MGWATAEQVQEITGTEVTPELVAQAAGIITIYAGRTPDMLDQLRARDAYWLRAATAWQAVFLASNVAVEGRNMGTRVETEGLSLDRSAEYQVVLAPLAARSLRNLSWKGNRSIVSRPYAVGGRVPAFELESSDAYGAWSPL